MTWFQFSFSDFSFSFLSILLEGVPFVLFGTLISGMIAAFLPARLMAQLLPRNTTLAIIISGGLGMIFPMCECGVVLVVRRLMSKGLPIACAVTYMLASPVVNPVVMISTFAAFSGQAPWMMTTMRLGIAFFVAVLVGFIVHRMGGDRVMRSEVAAMAPAKRRRGFSASALNEAELENKKTVPAPAVSFRGKLAAGLNAAIGDFLDVTFFLVIGAGLTAVFNTAVNQTLIMPVAEHPTLAVPGMMLLAFLLSLCSTSDAFVAATFVMFAPAAKLAFLVYGPMFDLKLIFLYSLIFKRRFVAQLGVGLFFIIGVICWRLSEFLL